MSKADESSVPSEWERLTIGERAEGVHVSVHVRPRSSRSAVLGVREGAIEVALTAPPLDGAANMELIKLIARALDLRRNDVQIVVGTSSRTKVLAVYGVNAAELRQRLARARR